MIEHIVPARFIGGGGETILSELVLRVGWTDLHQIWQNHRSNLDPLLNYYRCLICCFVSKQGPQRPNCALIDTPPVKIMGGWAKFPSRYLEQSSALLLHVFDFRCIAPFQNSAVQRRLVSKIDANFRSCWSPVKIRAGVGKMSEWSNRATQGPNHWYTFHGALLDVWEIRGRMAKKSSEAKYSPPD